MGFTLRAVVTLVVKIRLFTRIIALAGDKSGINFKSTPGISVRSPCRIPHPSKYCAQKEGYWRPQPDPSARSFAPACSLSLEVFENLFFRDPLISEHHLQARGRFLQRRSICFGALAPRRDVVTGGVAVACDGHRHIDFQQETGKPLAKLSDTNFRQ